MTYTPIQLEVIKRFWRKELTEGCLIQQWEYLMNIWCIYEWIYNMKEINSANCMQVQKSDIGEILWHIPEIFPDVARIAEERWWLLEIKFWLLTIHFKDRTYTSCKYDTIKPFLEQPESVLIELLTKIKW